MKTINYELVPSYWAICFAENCPLADKCQRKMAGNGAPSELTVGKCVTPRALHDGQCDLFHPVKTEVTAYGFSTIFQPVKKSDYTSMRKWLTAYLHGKKQYYEYRRGERPLSAKQQRAINRLFAGYGYPTPLQFDSLKEAYVFD